MHASITTISTIKSIIIIINIISRRERREEKREEGWIEDGVRRGRRKEGRGWIGVVCPGSDGASPYRP